MRIFSRIFADFFVFQEFVFQEFVCQEFVLSGVCLSGVCLAGVCLSGVCFSGVCHGTTFALDMGWDPKTQSFSVCPFLTLLVITNVPFNDGLLIIQ